MQLSCSPPVSVNSLLKSGPHRRISSSANATHPCCRKLVPFPPNCTPSSSYTATPTSSCSTSSSWSNVGISLARHGAVSWNTTIPVKISKRSLFIVCGIFERFTERAINSVMFSQKEAKLLGKDMVYEQHLLLGLIDEDRSPVDFWSPVSPLMSHEKLCRVSRREVGVSGNRIFRQQRCRSPPARSVFLRLQLITR
ncbi:hypothetical protein OROHE_000269 [Orobanche hederae]